MAENPLQDAAVQAAVSKLQLRSERQENVEQLVATFVDPGISVQLLNENNQILYGRRGTGKTHVLKVVHRTVQQRPDELAVYVDMRTLGSNTVFNDEGRPLHVRVASLLRDVLALVEGDLLEWATSPDKQILGMSSRQWTSSQLRLLERLSRIQRSSPRRVRRRRGNQLPAGK